MKYERTSRRGTLSFRFGYDIEDAEDRAVPYNHTGAMYRPSHFNFTLEAESKVNGELPRYEDLQVTAISISGPKLKKDGTPGNVTAREKIYTFEYEKTLPGWAMPLISYALKQLQGEA